MNAGYGDEHRYGEERGGNSRQEQSSYGRQEQQRYVYDQEMEQILGLFALGL